MELEFFTDPADFLTAAGEHLALDPVVNTVVTTIAERAAALPADARPEQDWWLVVRQDDGVVGVGMRTAPHEPFPPYLLPMPASAAIELARVLVARGEEVEGVNGALPAVELFADEYVRLTSGSVATSLHTRLFELGELIAPPVPAGALRCATQADLDLGLAWFRTFGIDADEQAGRTSGHYPVSDDPEDMRRRIDAGRIWIWEVDGEPVHLTGSNPPSFGVARIGPVYTPKEHRGRGYASTAVAQVSAAITASGARACLFTDQANPTSNAIYQAIGYRPVVDMVNLRITR